MQRTICKIRREIRKTVFSMWKFAICSRWKIAPSKMFKMRNDPIIITGMHRSGTSLLSQILLDMGVFLGKDAAYSKNEWHESLFFRIVNEWMLSVVHGDWDTVTCVEYLQKNESLIKKIELEILEKLTSYSFSQNFVGITKAQAFYKNPNFLWGWKDPRTTILLPIWKNIFPQGKYLFIYRNGIDVAESLRIREEKRSQNLHYLYDRDLSARCLNIEDAFSLWEEYNHIFLSTSSNLDLLQVRYENLLRNPTIVIQQISDFLNIPLNNITLDQITSKIRIKNAYKFLENPQLITFYEKTKQTPMMKKFGYDVSHYNSGNST